MKALPDKLSDLFTVAVNDLEKIQKDNKYKINMPTWHSYNKRNEICYVCMAGAVMAKTLGYDRKRTYRFFEIEGIENRNKLDRIDDFRKFDFRDTFIGNQDILDKLNKFIEDKLIGYRNLIPLEKAIPMYRKVINKMKELGV